MIYEGKLATGQKVYLENRDDQTVVTLSEDGNTQSQIQSRSFPTSAWQQPPALFKTPQGYILRAQGDKTFFFEIQATSITALDDAPQLDAKDAVELRETPNTPAPKPMQPMAPMKPMAPMQPMKPL